MKPEKLIIVSWDNCPECGSDIGFAEHSMAGEHAEECVYDGETAYCAECDATGCMSCDGEGGGFINWD